MVTIRLSYTVSDLFKIYRLHGNDVIVLSPLGGQQANSECRFSKSYRDFILVFNSNHTSIMHRFRYNQVEPLAGNDVLVLSPLRGAAAELCVRILVGRPRLYISV